MKLNFHGHSCFSIEQGDVRVLIDPFLTDNPAADVRPEHFEKLDAILVTHGHFDHIADVETVSKLSGAVVVSNFEIASHFGAKECNHHPMHIGGAHRFEWGRVKFTIAHHGSTGPNGESLGNPMGVILEMGGKKLYHAGDTGVFLDMRLIAELNGPFDVACLPIGDNFTMGVDDAAKAAEFLQAKVTVPMHYNTWPQIEVDADDFAAKVAQHGGSVRILQPGDSMDA